MKKRTVWLILGGIAVIVCVLWWAYIQFWSNASEKEDVSAKREADWSFQKPKVPETKLTDQEECALCGSRKESMTGMFSGKDAIGIISVNDWYIMDLKIKSGNEKENMPEDTEGKNTTRTTVGKNGRVLERSSESLRGISEIVVDYGEDRVLSMEKASQILPPADGERNRSVADFVPRTAQMNFNHFF